MTKCSIISCLHLGGQRERFACSKCGPEFQFYHKILKRSYFVALIELFQKFLLLVKPISIRVYCRLVSQFILNILSKYGNFVHFEAVKDLDKNFGRNLRFKMILNQIEWLSTDLLHPWTQTF